MVAILDFRGPLEFEIWVRAKLKSTRSSAGSVKVTAYAENIQLSPKMEIFAYNKCVENEKKLQKAYLTEFY